MKKRRARKVVGRRSERNFEREKVDLRAFRGSAWYSMLRVEFQSVQRRLFSFNLIGYRTLPLFQNKLLRERQLTRMTRASSYNFPLQFSFGKLCSLPKTFPLQIRHPTFNCSWTHSKFHYKCWTFNLTTTWAWKEGRELSIVVKHKLHAH